jgi:mRNA-degrading endonuclease toxin of MazEF toxin-antitoxin module
LAQRQFEIKQWSIITAVCPFSGDPDKKRPLLILKRSSDDEFVCCVITSQPSRQDKKITLRHEDYNGYLLKHNPSYIDPSSITRISISDIEDCIGNLKSEKISEVVDFINNMRKPIIDNKLVNIKDEIANNLSENGGNSSMVLQRPKKPKS